MVVKLDIAVYAGDVSFDLPCQVTQVKQKISRSIGLLGRTANLQRCEAREGERRSASHLSKQL